MISYHYDYQFNISVRKTISFGPVVRKNISVLETDFIAYSGRIVHLLQCADVLFWAKEREQHKTWYI